MDAEKQTKKQINAVLAVIFVLAFLSFVFVATRPKPPEAAPPAPTTPTTASAPTQLDMPVPIPLGHATGTAANVFRNFPVKPETPAVAWCDGPATFHDDIGYVAGCLHPSKNDAGTALCPDPRDVRLLLCPSGTTQPTTRKCSMVDPAAWTSLTADDVYHFVPHAVSVLVWTQLGANCNVWQVTR